MARPTRILFTLIAAISVSALGPALGAPQPAAPPPGQALRARAEVLHHQIEDMRSELIALAQAQGQDEGRTALDRAHFTELNRRERVVESRLFANRAQLARLLSALQLFARNPPPALMVSPRSANDAVRAAILMRALTPELERRAAALRKEAESLARLRRQTAIAHESLFLSESELADRRAELEAMMSRRPK